MGKVANRPSLAFSERSQLSQAIPQFHVARETNVKRVSANRAIRIATQRTQRYDRQRKLAIRIAAITLASDSAITIARFRPSKIQAFGLMPTSGTSTSSIEPFVQDQWHLSCAMSILWRALPIQGNSMAVLSQLMIFENFQGKRVWRTSPSSNATSKGFSLKPRVFVCGPMASKIKSWMKLKGSIPT